MKSKIILGMAAAIVTNLTLAAYAGEAQLDLGSFDPSLRVELETAIRLARASLKGMMRKRHGRIVPDRIVEFLLLDGEFPRAVRYSIGQADEALHAITGTPRGGFSCASEQRIGLLRSELDFARVEAILEAGLHEFFDNLETRMNAIDECIGSDFFGRRAADAGAWV